MENSQTSIVHAIPGRIRLRIDYLTNDQEFARLEEKLNSDSHVTKVRVNSWAASIVIHYQRNNLSDREIYVYLIKLIQKAQTKSVTIQPVADGEQWSGLRLPALAILLALGANKLNWPWLRPVARMVLISAILPVAQKAFKSLFLEGKLNIDCLDFLALSLSSLQGKIITPSLVIILHEVGDIIREKTSRATETQTVDLLNTIGHFAWVEREGKLTQIKSDEVQKQETVTVYPGEQIPVDGNIIEGKAVVDQQQLTGESMPIVAEVGTYVYASTLVRSGKIRLIADRVGNKTRAAASIELLQKAPVYDTRMANYAAKIADKLILPSLVLASIVLITTRDMARAASILTLDFVTGIRVSIPTAFLSALNHTTRHGVLVRSGRTLELLAEIDTIVFDKTGTLTQGDVVVVGVKTVTEEQSRYRLLQLAASAEQRITHPVAEAIAHYAQEQGTEILPRGQWDYKVGLGMKAEIEGQTVLVGSARFLSLEGVELTCFYEDHDCLKETCDVGSKCPVVEWLSLVYVACNGEFLGVIQYTDPLRPSSPKLIQRLQNDYGMEVHLLTGDNQLRANQVAETLKIPRSFVHAEAFPEQKASIVRQLHQSGKTVAFVGDGVNDSVALAYADVSVSFEKGSDVARETADVVLMNNDLASLLEVIIIAKETKNLIEQNTVIVVGPNLVALGLASTVGLNPLLATIVHNGSAIAAGLNSLRPLVQHQLESKKNSQDRSK